MRRSPRSTHRCADDRARARAFTQRGRRSSRAAGLSPVRPDMTTASLTFESIRARPVLLKLQRPIVARIATITEWPLILIDLDDRGRHRRPQLSRAIHGEGDALSRAGAARLRRNAEGPARRAGRALRGCAQVAAFRRLPGPVDDRRVGARHGRVGCAGEGRRHAAVRAARRLGRAVKAYNSNGLWLRRRRRSPPKRSSFATRADSPA